MIQVAFDGDSAEEALASGPSRVAYAQHSGGEVADWDDPKIDKEGTHPVVYAAAGSHASYFGSAIYLGTGENGSGLGCDDTREPLRRVRPDVVTLATDPDPDGPTGWVTYEGVWGEPRGGFNGPPDGPARKRQWREPLRWMAGLRTGSPEVPGSTTIGPNVSSVFCSVVEAVSDFVNLAARSRGTALAVLGVLFVGDRGAAPAHPLVAGGRPSPSGRSAPWDRSSAPPRGSEDRSAARSAPSGCSSSPPSSPRPRFRRSSWACWAWTAGWAITATDP